MSNGQELPGEDYHNRLTAATDKLTTSLKSGDLEATLQLAEAEAATLNRDFHYLMDLATSNLFVTGDPALQKHGLAYMAWDAEHFPDVKHADDITYDANYDSRYPESRDFARRCFEISLLHFKFAVKAEDFVPTPAFFEHLNPVVGRMGESDFRDLSKAAIKEFGPLAIIAATNYQPSEPREGLDTDKYAIDETLASLAVAIRKTDPELAVQARDLITEPMWKTICITDEADISLTEALFAGNFEAVQDIMDNPDYLSIQRLWLPMANRLLTEGPESAEWGNAVLDSILAANPDYFSEYGQASDDAVDLFLGPKVGTVIGLLGRTDIIDTLIIPQERQNVAAMTAVGIANGLGLRANQEGLDHLMTRVPHYTYEFKQILGNYFDDGLEVAKI